MPDFHDHEPLLLDEVTFKVDRAATEAERPSAAKVTLPEPMLRYACNQQGCCCGGWRIPFRPDDLVRLRAHLDEADAEKLVADVQMKIDFGPDGERVVKEVYLTKDDGDCRFLGSDRKACGVHAKHGVKALPNLCVDFPVATYESPGGVDFYFDPVCPSVLDQIAESDAPLTIAEVRAPYGDDAFALRSAHVRGKPVARLGAIRLSGEEIDLIRRRVVSGLADASRPVWQHLLAIDSAYAEVASGRPVESFDLRYDHEPAAYLRFLGDCLRAHGVGTLARVWESYRRFVFAIPTGPGSAAWRELDKHLRDWQPAYEKYLAPSEDALRPLHLRFLAHRHFAPFLSIQGELKYAAGAIVHTFATSLRYAAALGAVLRRPVDREVMKAALGAAEYFYRSLEIPPDSLPWFGIGD